MTTELTMPGLAMSMKERELADWFAPDGSRVEVDEPIYSVESEKATQEITAPVAGVLTHFVPARTTCEVGTKLDEIADQ